MVSLIDQGNIPGWGGGVEGQVAPATAFPDVPNGCGIKPSLPEDEGSPLIVLLGGSTYRSTAYVLGEAGLCWLCTLIQKLDPMYEMSEYAVRTTSYLLMTQVKRQCSTGSPQVKYCHQVITLYYTYTFKYPVPQIYLEIPCTTVIPSNNLYFRYTIKSHLNDTHMYTTFRSMHWV
jgi:hypothetical protein